MQYDFFLGLHLNLYLTLGHVMLWWYICYGMVLLSLPFLRTLQNSCTYRPSMFVILNQIEHFL